MQTSTGMDHFCLVLGPTDMNALHAELIAKGIMTEEQVRPAWEARATASNSRSGTQRATK